MNPDVRYAMERNPAARKGLRQGGKENILGRAVDPSLKGAKSMLQMLRPSKRGFIYLNIGYPAMRERMHSQSSFKDCLSRQIAEAILIHLSKDKLLNSKNEYNSNCRARVTVEENVYERKKRERKEEEDSWKEKKAWNDCKWNRGAGKRRLEQVLPDGWKRRDGKRARLDLDDEPQVVEDSWLGQIDLEVWLDAAEGICLRAGNLRSRLERDGSRVATMMASLEQNKFF